MTKRYSILQKKLQRLESVINDVVSRNPLDDNIYLKDIEQRFEFLKSLLLAEIKSSPSKPHHLNHIGKRLSELENVFRDWREFRTTTTNDDNNHHYVETVSTCSCSESCLNDDGEAGFEVGSFEGKEKVSEGSVKEEEEEEVNVKEKKQSKGLLLLGGGGGVVGCRMICGSFGFGVVIGMVFMGFVMVNVCERFSYGQRRMCYTPT